MSIKFEMPQYELHPEGWWEMAIVGAVEEAGSFGPRVKWLLESEKRTEEGKPFALTYWTGPRLSRKSKLAQLMDACEIPLPTNPDEASDLDIGDFQGKVVRCKVEHKETDSGVFANIIEVARRAAPRKPKAAQPALAVGQVDPFEKE